MIASALLGVAALAVHVLATSLLLHLTLPLAPVSRHMASAFVVHAAATALGLAAIEGFGYWQSAAIFWFGVMAYLYVFSAFYKSISLAILEYLTARPGRSATMAEIFDRCVRPSFDGRTGILVEGGLADRRDDRFEITERGRQTANRIFAVQRLMGIERFGLYFRR